MIHIKVISVNRIINNKVMRAHRKKNPLFVLFVEHKLDSLSSRPFHVQFRTSHTPPHESFSIELHTYRCWCGGLLARIINIKTFCLTGGGDMHARVHNIVSKPNITVYTFVSTRSRWQAFLCTKRPSSTSTSLHGDPPIISRGHSDARCARALYLWRWVLKKWVVVGSRDTYRIKHT